MSPWFLPLVWLVGVVCGRSVWFMRRMRSLNVAEARSAAAARAQAHATGVVIVGGSGDLGVAESGGVAAVPGDVRHSGGRGSLVSGGQVIDFEVLDAEVVA